MDRLENVRYVLDESGAIVKSYLYSPFGQIHIESGSLNQPYQYVGGEGYYTEQDINLQLLGQRWYDAEVGRFISRDPIGEEGGLNLYGYVGNNPMNEIDPEGLSNVPPQPPAGPKRECWNFLFNPDRESPCRVADCYGCCDILFPHGWLLDECYKICDERVLSYLKCVYTGYWKCEKKYKDDEKKKEKCKKRWVKRCRKKYIKK